MVAPTYSVSLQPIIKNKTEHFNLLHAFCTPLVQHSQQQTASLPHWLTAVLGPTSCPTNHYFPPITNTHES